MTIGQIFETLPKSEKTLAKHKYSHLGYQLMNDMGHPCEYRVVDQDSIEIGMVRYYRGRLLSAYEKA